MAQAGTSKSGTVEDTYKIVRRAVETRHPLSAIYNNHLRLLCPHRLGRNRLGQLRVLCYQFGGESSSGLEPPGSEQNWRCIALDKLSDVRILSEAWRTAPNHSRPASCVPDADVDAEDYRDENPALV